ncbi:hypothetical protein AB0958_40905 [Streptomyces sp. NPDC006655]|uniref:hypothetical protein n=1 Tax=Streptomyces sp. NPDC006655 TaxID=3156898 RepID=UPI0034530635
MRTKITTLLATSLLLVLAALLAGSPASAAPGSAVSFTAQARAAGLTAAQAGALQDEVNRDLASLGGKQVAPNRIQLEGATLYLAVPGEAHPRDLTAGTGATPFYDPCAGGGADHLHMCAYSKTYYTGSELDMYSCKRYYVSTWSGPGSWDNEQSDGTVAYMYGPTGAFVYKTPPAPSWDATGNWSSVHSIVNC